MPARLIPAYPKGTIELLQQNGQIGAICLIVGSCGFLNARLSANQASSKMTFHV
jgi:hypothetical protein